jgi:hypothetical protein
VTTNTPEGTGWHVVTQNVGDVTAYQLVVRAVCRAADTTVSTVASTSELSAAVKNVTTPCPAGATVVGGGYSIAR